MRKIVNSTFISLDGVVNHMEKWHFDFVDDETDQLALDQLSDSDALLMGRTTYEVYESVWPGRDGEYADRINAMRKYVVSRTLAQATWAGTTVIGGDLVDEVAAIKEQPGKNILMHGFGPVARTLLRHNLLDELHLWVHPMIAGVGTTDDMLFTEGMDARLELIGTEVFGSGVVVLSYRAAERS